MLPYRKSQLEKIKKSLLIFGSRSLHGKDVIEIINKYVIKYEPNFIISAFESDGVCQEVKNYLMHYRLGITYIGYTRDELRAQGMYDDRSKKAIKTAERALFIWDGISKGTKHEIYLTKKYNIPFDIEIIENNSEKWFDNWII